jgi:general secretion pathway protein L
LPGANIGNRIVPFVARESRHLQEVVPFQLEDGLLGDVEELHFAFGPWRYADGNAEGADARVPVAWCRREWLQDQLEPLRRQELELCLAIPEPLLLVRKSGWALHLEDHLIAHIDDGFGFSVEPELMTAALELLLQQMGAPDRVQVSAPTSGLLDQLRSALPPELAGIADFHCQSLTQRCVYLQTDPLNRAADFHELNLLQGEFSPRLPLARWWRQWRGLAAIMLVAVAAWSVNSLLEMQQLKRQQEQLQQQLETAFRSVVPEGLLVDARQQLRNLLLSLDAGTDYRGPIQLLASIAPALEEDASVEIKGFAYDRGDVRLNCQAGSFTAIDQFLSRLQQQGLKPELVHSNADGDGQRARIRIGWGQL